MRIHCPSCGLELTEPSVCPRCNFDPREVALFDPKHFVWQAMLFSFVVPALLAGLNWGRLGDRRRKWIWIGGGTGGLTVLSVVFGLLPESASFGRLVGWLVNLPIALILLEQQKPIFTAHKGSGGRTASVFKGTMAGIGATAAVLAVLIAAYAVIVPDPASKGVDLLRAGRCEEAAKEFEQALVDAPKDLASRYNLALAYACQERADLAIAHMHRYLLDRPDDAKAHAWLAVLYDYSNHPDLSEEHARRAESLEPGIVDRLFGEDGNENP